MVYKLVDATTTYIEDTVKIEDGVIINPNVTLRGKTIIGKNTIIDSNTIITDSIVGKNNYITSSVIEKNNIIGNNNTIGPFTHIREDNIIGNNNEIGSYVEIKKSRIGNNNFAKHLSYIGNVFMTNNINLGAGVIFANFHSKKNTKSNTIVEDYVSIGSNTTIVAPVKIGKNSLIGAGSTVTKDIMKNSLYFLRDKELYKKGYYDESMKNEEYSIVDIITRKKNGEKLNYNELSYAFNGYLEGRVEDYQMSSLLMTICFSGMYEEEIFNLTDIFIKSGITLDLSDIKGIKVDKHSTGGVGDKTTLVIAPIVASLSIPVIKMSGRGLGYTGGTIDKLESIPGFNTSMTFDKIKKQVQEIGIAITSQTENLVPMDKAIYALRDVSGTTSSIPLIASSIMSKKIAGGADKIVIDIKVGNGALIETNEDAKILADIMKKIGDKYKKEVVTIISPMDTPLGYCIGNALEVIEAINILQDKEHNNLTELCITLASTMVSLSLNISKIEASRLVIDSLKSGKAYNKFLEFVKYQGGNINVLKITSPKIVIKSTKNGVIEGINAKELGKICVNLGAGRKKKEDTIDSSAGIKLEHLIGEYVQIGDILATVYSKKKNIEVDIDKIFVIK